MREREFAADLETTPKWTARMFLEIVRFVDEFKADIESVHPDVRGELAVLRHCANVLHQLCEGGPSVGVVNGRVVAVERAPQIVVVRRKPTPKVEKKFRICARRRPRFVLRRGDTE